MKIRHVLSCEHGGNQIPPQWLFCFQQPGPDLNSHRGFDYGALSLFELCIHPGVDFAHFATTTRLLVDLNRTLEADSLFSEYTRSLSEAQQTQLVEELYVPYRQQFIDALTPWLAQGDRVLHVSVHSFTPQLDGVVRNSEIGILFDPSFKVERQFARMWKRQILKVLPHFRVKFNYPYLGKTDGHVVYWRRKFPNQYAGIELEMNYNAATPECMQLLAHSYRMACKRFELGMASAH